ncbi:ribbon-helix-helix protein, CopG family [bacterium]|nr:ribbon-helix-helix protein, CopG family [bacterium]
MSARVRTFWLDDALVDELDRRASELDVTRSAFVKDVLRRECEMPPPEQPSRP